MFRSLFKPARSARFRQATWTFRRRSTPARAAPTHVVRPLRAPVVPILDQTPPPPPPRTLPNPTFENPEEAFQHRTTSELVRAYVIFSLCSIEFFVEHQETLLKWMRRLMGKRLFSAVMKRTFYGQFLVGEDRSSVLKAASLYRQHGVIPMFAYTAREIHGVKGESHLLYNDPCWKHNFDALMEEVDIASATAQECQDYIKMSGKFTFMVAPDVLESCSSAIDYQTQLMRACRGDNATTPMKDCIDETMRNLPQYAAKLGLALPKVPWNWEDNFDSYAANLTTHLALLDDEDLALMIKKAQCGPRPKMNSGQRRELMKLWDWMIQLGEEARRSDVCIVVDAEQTYFQCAIEDITLDLMRVLNKRRPVIHNTYQNYLMRSLQIIQRDLHLAEKEDFCIGLKPVRGAYIEEERGLARDNCYQDPTNESYEATTEMYHRVARLILQHIKNTPPGKTQVTFATHNVDTVKAVIEMMREINVAPQKSNIAFAQLVGMRDHIAFPLGRAGYPAHKLLHYGPVDQAMAYMSRRLRENRAGLGTAACDVNLIGQELKRRRQSPKPEPHPLGSQTSP